MTSIHLSAKPGIQPQAQLYLQGVPTGPALALQEIPGTGEYATQPAPGTPAGQYLVVFYDGTRKIASGLLDWDGSQEVAPATQTSLTAVSAAVQAIGQPLQAQDYEAPANADIAAIRFRTDPLTDVARQATSLAVQQLSIEIQTRVDAALGGPGDAAGG